MTVTGDPEIARLIVLLHGHGDDPERLGAWSQELASAWCAKEVLLPSGPHRTNTGPSWLPTDDPEPETVNETLDLLDETIEETCLRSGTARAQTMVGGYSQGAAVALALALRSGSVGPFAGCFSLAGFLWPPTAVEYDFEAAAHRLPVLVVQGATDAVVPVQQGRSAARLLHRHAVPVTYRELPQIGHELNIELLRATLPWLTAVASGDRPADPSP